MSMPNTASQGSVDISLEPFSKATDIDFLVPLHIRAYNDDATTPIQFPNGADTHFVRFLYEKAMVKDESCIAFTCRTNRDFEPSGELAAIPKGTIVGFTVWWDRSIVPATAATDEQLNDYPEAGDPDYNRIWYERCFHKEEEYVGGIPHVRLLNLIVDPVAQGRKFGGAMLDACINYARKRKQAVYLEASKKGEPVYASRGFKKVGEIILDTPASQKKGLSATLVCMLKEYET